MNFQAVDLEGTYQTGRASLPAVKQFELLGALVEVVAQTDAVAPNPDDMAIAANRIKIFFHAASDKVLENTNEELHRLNFQTQ